ncbi:MAG: hypothetical protein IJ404_04035 [Clostridia bacterium]|nr:hypothetical protein [Clostridia bacterium]
MNKRIKVLVSAVLAAVMLVICIPFTAAAASSTQEIHANEGTLSGETITWTFDDFTWKTEKASSTTNIRVTDTDHFRAYKGSKTTITALGGKTISKVIITHKYTDNVLNQAAYAEGSTAATVSLDSTGKITTIQLNTPAESLVIVAGAQWRVYTVEVVFYEAGAACEHAYDGCTDAECNLCSEPRTAGQHEYTNDYDAICDKCSQPRTVTLPAEGTTLDFATVDAIGKVQNGETVEKYYVEGEITEIYNDTYGNMYIKDENGTELCVYGSYSADGTQRYDAVAEADRWKVGDKVKVYGVLGAYNNKGQVENGWVTVIPAGSSNQGGNTGSGNQGAGSPDTGDNVAAYIAVAVVALFGIAYVSKKKH